MQKIINQKRRNSQNSHSYFFLTIYFFYFKKVFIKDNYKLVQYYFNSITVFQFFQLWDSFGPLLPPPGGEGGGESQDSENPKWETTPSHLV